MCYSLEASITAGLGLGLAGYGMVSKALRHDRRMLLFAAFPLVFSVHQFVEAAVWLNATIPSPASLIVISTRSSPLRCGPC
ncbi:MAG: DUF6629 family protein [Methylocystis silviterrae]